MGEAHGKHLEHWLQCRGREKNHGCDEHGNWQCSHCARAYCDECFELHRLEVRWYNQGTAQEINPWEVTNMGWVNREPEFIRLGEECPEVEGTLNSWDTIEVQGREVQRVTMTTSDGPKRFLCGAQLEGLLNGVPVGEKIRITYKETVDVNKGRMKVFALDVWEP